MALEFVGEREKQLSHRNETFKRKKEKGDVWGNVAGMKSLNFMEFYA